VTQNVDVIDVRDLSLAGKRVLIREDLNVPLINGEVGSDARIRAALPSIKYLLEKGAKVMLMSHLGRPEEGVSIEDQPSMSMEPIAKHLEKMLDISIPVIDQYLDGFEFADDNVVLFENIRINQGEKANDVALAKKLAALCDIFVMDAFGTAHRAQASTEGVARYAPIAAAGPLLIAELEALSKALANPEKPLVAIVGGSKVSTKLQVLDALSDKVDHLIVGGGIANTFLAASGLEMGKSLYEQDLISSAKDLMAKVDIPIPKDVVTSKAFDRPDIAETKSVNDVQSDDMVLDLGPASLEKIKQVIGKAKTIIWNGPLGVFEQDAFAEGTKALTQAIADSDAFSIAGGGDTIAAIDKYQVANKISYISTGGGAFLEFVEGKNLPAVSVLVARAQRTRTTLNNTKED
jgi:phosphoglycerate kinase